MYERDSQTLGREAEQLRAEIAPISGANLQQLLTEAYATPAHIVEQARMMLK